MSICVISDHIRLLRFDFARERVSPVIAFGDCARVPLYVLDHLHPCFSSSHLVSWRVAVAEIVCPPPGFPFIWVFLRFPHSDCRAHVVSRQWGQLVIRWGPGWWTHRKRTAPLDLGSGVLFVLRKGVFSLPLSFSFSRAMGVSLWLFIGPSNPRGDFPFLSPLFGRINMRSYFTFYSVNLDEKREILRSLVRERV